MVLETERLTSMVATSVFQEMCQDKLALLEVHWCQLCMVGADSITLFCFRCKLTLTVGVD